MRANMTDDDICYDESGFSAGAGAPKSQPVPSAQPVKPDADNAKVTVTFHKIEPQ